MKPADEDTIAALATPLGQAGIGIIRLSGPKAWAIARSLFKPAKPIENFSSHRLYLGHIADPATQTPLDEVLVSFMKAPRSYTREDVVEINSHSGYALLAKILSLVLSQGARLAEPGEFTFRAFKNGRIDLLQAEAVMDLINAKSEKGLALVSRQLQGRLGLELGKIRAAAIDILALIEVRIDFPEDTRDEVAFDQNLGKRIEQDLIAPVKALCAGFEQRKIWLEGIRTIILGRVNVGKSSLLNRLAGEERAIVTPVPGTTRDIIEMTVHIEGVPFRIIDTAGFRKARGTVEKIGQRLTQAKLQEADLVLLLIDQSRTLHRLDLELLAQLPQDKTLLLLNKSDLSAKISPAHLRQKTGDLPQVKISALTGNGMDVLYRTLLQMVLNKEGAGGDPGHFAPNLRQKQALTRAWDSFASAVQSLGKKQPAEIIALDLQVGLEALGDMIGETTPDHILDRIFSQFCIGK